MSNFKSGSGDLDFGDDDEKDENDTDETETTESDSEISSEQSVSEPVLVGGTGPNSTPAEKYPYFIRRNNVGDERDTRLEIHVRDKVASQEAEFRSVLADRLETNEITKTDAREFALLTAFHHPERVAELMRDEGFGALD
jgi:hypothetical protein